MKKFQKMCAVLAALALGLICFSGCSNDTGGSSGGGNSNNEEETPKVTVVAKYVAENNKSLYFIFYSDSSFEYIERNQTISEGEYYGTPTSATTITLVVKKEWSDNAQTLISKTYDVDIKIRKDSDGNLYFWKGYDYFYLNY